MINIRKNSTLCISSTIEDTDFTPIARVMGIKKIYQAPPGLTFLLHKINGNSADFKEALDLIENDSSDKHLQLVENLLPAIPFCKHIEKVSGRPPVLVCHKSDMIFQSLFSKYSIEVIQFEELLTFLKDQEENRTDYGEHYFDSPPSPDITGRIIETSPNGIVFLNKDLEIIKMNGSFKKLFNCSDAINGEHISGLLDPEYFEELSVGNRTRIEKTGPCGSDGTVCHQILYPITEHNEFVGIYININKRVRNEQHLEEISRKAVSQARKLQDHQIEAAQQIVRLIGETTSRSETLVSSMMSIFSNEHKDHNLKNIHRESNE